MAIKCENPKCGKDVVPLHALSMRIPEVDDKLHFFCDAGCALEAAAVWEEMKKAGKA